MKTTAHPAARGHRFTLTAETDADHALLDAIDWEGLHAAVLSGTHKTPEDGGWAITGITLAIDRKHPQALETQSSRQLLRAARELFRLCLGEEALNRHIGLDTPNPDSQEKIAALLDKLHIVLDAGIGAIRQSERLGEKVDTAHDVTSSENAIVGQSGGAA